MSDRPPAGSPVAPPDGPPPAAVDRASAARRRIWVAILAVLAGAAATAGSALLVWWTATLHSSLAGDRPVTWKGSALLPELVPIALIALAGFAASFAVHGVLRRIVGLVVAAAGVLVGARAIAAATTAPARPVEQLPPGTLSAASGHPAGAILAVLGGLLILAAGALIATGPAGTRMGARYDSPAAAGDAAERRTGRAAARAGVRPASEPGADWWRVLDAGQDPTAEPDRDPAAHPDSDAT